MLMEYTYFGKNTHVYKFLFLEKKNKVTMPVSYIPSFRLFMYFDLELLNFWYIPVTFNGTYS